METKETLRLGAVSGASGLSNHLVYAPPSASTTSTSVLMFFGGDVQDYPEIMLAHRDNKHYVEWSLTNTARLLATKFPAHHVFVVKPNRMERKTFSCFDNFVMSNSVGAPTHEPGTAATRHLASLISAGLRTAEAKMNFHSQENDIGIAPHNEDDDLQQCKSIQHSSKSQTCDEVSIEIHDVTLIGFSKGCVVLNQLITEFHSMDVIESPLDELHKEFISKVHNMYWLDGGHAGGSKTWITTPTILKFLATLKHINIHIHVTPYQLENVHTLVYMTVKRRRKFHTFMTGNLPKIDITPFHVVRDEQRPWIRKECKAFYDILRRAGAKVYYSLHFEDEPASLMLHFRVLKEFNRN